MHTHIRGFPELGISPRSGTHVQRHLRCSEGAPLSLPILSLSPSLPLSLPILSPSLSLSLPLSLSPSLPPSLPHL